MIGLDTLQVTLPASEVTFSPLFGERLRCPDEKNGTLIQDAGREKNFGLWRDTSGAAHFGRKAFVNADNFQLEVLARGDAGLVAFQFSGAAFTGDNTAPMDASRLRFVVSLLAEELEGWGVSADLSAARVRRGDTARNIQLRHTVPAYLDIWRSAAFRWNVRPSFPAPGTFNLSLGSGKVWPAQWAFYDKGKERDEKTARGPAKRSVPASKLARFELRQRGPALARSLEVERVNLGHLMQPGALELLAAAHRVSARDDLLPMLPETRLAFPCDETRLASLLAELRGGNTPARYNADAARVALLLASGGVAGASEAWESDFAPVLVDDSKPERERKKRARSRERSELRRVWNFINTASGSASGPARGELVFELRDKLLNVD